MTTLYKKLANGKIVLMTFLLVAVFAAYLFPTYSAGYRQPTPIQAATIPHVLAGRDVLGCAQTGTGKTAAFALPILQRLVKTPRSCIRALVIAPTRELSDQIHTTFETLGRQTRLRSFPIYGGVPIAPQVRKLRSGVEIIVACPGRLLDHIRQGTIRLSNLEMLVFDEADRMLDLGFLPDIREIIKHVSHFPASECCHRSAEVKS